MNGGDEKEEEEEEETEIKMEHRPKIIMGRTIIIMLLAIVRLCVRVCD